MSHKPCSVHSLFTLRLHVIVNITVYTWALKYQEETNPKPLRYPERNPLRNPWAQGFEAYLPRGFIYTATKEFDQQNPDWNGISWLTPES